MVRLGAKRTVKGYLDEVANQSLLAERDDGPMPAEVSRNWNRLVADLPRKWRPQVFVDRLSEFHRKAGWGFYRSQRRSALGPEHAVLFSHPSAVDLVHSSYMNLSEPTWPERGVMTLGWRCIAREGKAKIDILPSSFIVSQHALERLYERTGGTTYEQYPRLVIELCDTVLGKLDRMVAAGVILPAGTGKAVTAFPVCNGLAIIEATRVFTAMDIPQLGSLIDVKGGDVLLKNSTLPLDQRLLSPEIHEGMSYAIFYVMRTYYGPEEIAESKADALTLVNLVADCLPEHRPWAEVRMAGGTNTPTTEHAYTNSHAFRSLVAKTVEALHWLKDRPNKEYLMYSSGQGKIASTEINSHRIKRLQE